MMTETTILALACSAVGLIIISAIVLVWWKAFSKQGHDKLPIFTCSNEASEKLTGVIERYKSIDRDYAENAETAEPSPLPAPSAPLRLRASYRGIGS